jgi:hypothetical protein
MIAYGYRQSAHSSVSWGTPLYLFVSICVSGSWLAQKIERRSRLAIGVLIIVLRHFSSSSLWLTWYAPFIIFLRLLGRRTCRYVIYVGIRWHGASLCNSSVLLVLPLTSGNQ